MIQRFIHKIQDEIALAKVIRKPPFEVNPESLHGEARILYVVKGESLLQTPTKSISLKAGDTLIICSGNIVNNWQKSPAYDSVEVVLFRLYPGLMETIYKRLPSLQLNPSQVDLEMQPVYKIEAEPLISQYIEGLQHYFEQPQLLQEDLILLKTQELLFLLMQIEGAAMQSILKNMFHPMEHQFTEIIHAHLFEKLSLDALAHLCGLSLSSFNRKFKKIYHTSPKKYILEQRLSKARELLARPELRVSDVAFDCCFEDPANFSKSFSALFGVSPSDYRKSILA